MGVVRKMGEKGLRLLILSGLALLAVSTAANAVEPECLPANICGYSYYVIQENGDLLRWGDYSSDSYQNAEILMKNVASIVPSDLHITLAIDRERTLRVINKPAYTSTSSSDSLLENVATAKYGLNHYLALQEAGTLYVGGKNESGQLGLGEADTIDHEPTKLLSGVISITTLDNSSYAVLDDGTLLFWGKLAGHPSCTAPVAIGSGFAKLLSGKYVLSADHTLYQMVWEENSDHFSFTPIMENVLYASNNLVVQEDGSLWGLDDNTPLVPTKYSVETDSTHPPIKLMEDVSYVTAGQFYSIVVLKDESMWLLPNQDLIASNPDQKYVPEKLMDHAPIPQIEIERIDPQGNRLADFPTMLSSQEEAAPKNTEANEINPSAFLGVAVVLIIAAAVVCVLLLKLRRIHRLNK